MEGKKRLSGQYSSRGAICERGKWFRRQRTNLPLCEGPGGWMWEETCWDWEGGRQEWLKEKKKTIGKGTGVAINISYFFLYPNHPPTHMWAICIHKKSSRYSLSHPPHPDLPYHFALRSCVMATWFIVNILFCRVPKPIFPFTLNRHVQLTIKIRTTAGAAVNLGKLFFSIDSKWTFMVQCYFY